MRQPPHAFQLFGRTIEVRWLDPKRKLPTKQRRHGETLDGMTVVWKNGACRIFLHPGMRRKGPEYVFMVFAHELLHAFVETLSAKKIRGYVKPILRHSQIYKLSVPLGTFLYENWKTTPAKAMTARSSVKMFRRAK